VTNRQTDLLYHVIAMSGHLYQQVASNTLAVAVIWLSNNKEERKINPSDMNIELLPAIYYRRH